MPVLAWACAGRLREGDPERVAVALQIGYRLFDTRSCMGTNATSSRVRESGSAKEVFVTTKLWNNDHGYESALRRSRRAARTRLDYIDCISSTGRTGLRHESWKALLKIHDEGSPLDRRQQLHDSSLEELLPATPIAPAVNQVEFHPFLTRRTCSSSA